MRARRFHFARDCTTSALVAACRISKDTEFTSALSDKYKEKILPQTGIFIKRNVKISFVLLLLSVILSFDLRMQNINIFPDALAALMLLSFFISIGRKTKINLAIPIAISALGVVSGVVSMIFEIRFFKDYTWDSIFRTEPAMNAYTLMCVTAIINTLIFAAIFAFVLITLKATVKAHTGIVSVSNAVNESARKSMNKSIYDELKRTLIIDACLMGVYTVTDICYVLFAKDFGAMMLINAIGVTAFGAMLIKTYFDIYEAVAAKYILE